MESLWLAVVVLLRKEAREKYQGKTQGKSALELGTSWGDLSEAKIGYTAKPCRFQNPEYYSEKWFW